MFLTVFSKNKVMQIQTVGASVDEAKQEIFNQCGILPENQILRQNTIVLESGKTFNDYPICPKPFVFSVSDINDPIIPVNIANPTISPAMLNL
jgi:hypothetical protein